MASPSTPRGPALPEPRESGERLRWKGLTIFDSIKAHIRVSKEFEQC